MGRSIFLSARLCMQLHAGRHRFDFMHFLARGGDWCFEFISAVTKKKSGGDFYSVAEEEAVDAHRECKPLLIRNDTTQARPPPPLPLSQAYWFYNGLCDVCCKSTGLHTAHTAGKRLNRTPELRAAAVEMDAAQIKANREGFTFTTLGARLQ